MIEAAKLQITVDAETSKAERGLDSLGKKVSSAGREMATTGAIITGAIGVPLVAMATAAVNSAATFEQSMNILQQVSGATGAQMDAMSDQALQLGADTVFSANEAAGAMLELAKAGMETEEVMDAIPGVMDLAAAGGVALAEAASLTAATLNAFGLEATESTRIADLLAATANASAADIVDLGQGLKQAGFAFKLANQPVDNLAASLAILTNVGLTGSDAGTALKNAFMRMMNPTKEAEGVMNELGISFYDASGQMKDLSEIIDVLNVATTGMSDQQRDAALATIFLSDGMKAMIPLMTEGKDGFNAMLTEVNEVGAASEVADARMAGLRGGIEELSGSIDTALVTAAQPFLDTLGNIARGAADAITAFSDLDQNTQNATFAFLGTLAAAGALMLTLGGLTAAVTALSIPLLLVGVGAAILAAAWTGNWGDIQGKTEEAIGVITPLIDGLAVQMSELAAGVSDAFANTTFPTADQLMQDFKAGDWQKLTATIRTTAIDLMVNLDTELNLTGKASQLRAELLGVINGVGAAISGLDIGAGKLNLDGLRGKVLGGLTKAINGISFGEESNVFAGLVDKLTAAAKGLDFSGINWVDVLQTALLGKLGLAIKGIQWVMSSEDFGALRTSVVDAIKTINWGELGTAFAGLGSAVLDQLSLVGQDMIADVSTAFTKFTGIKLTPDSIKFVVPPLPSIDLPSPVVNMSTPEPITLPPPKITVSEPQTETDFTEIGTRFVNRLMAGLTTQINEQDWNQIGENLVNVMAGSITRAFTTSGKIVVGVPGWIGDAQMRFNKTMLEAGNKMSASMGEWLATTAADLEGNFLALLSAFDTAFTGFLTGVRDRVLGLALGTPSDATSMSDTLRSRESASQFQWPPFPTFEWPTFTWPEYKPFKWPEFTTPAWVERLLAWNPLAGLSGSGLGSGSAVMTGDGNGGPSFLDDESRIGGSKGRYSYRPPAEDTAAMQLDWAKYITPLDWATFITPFDWDANITELVWDGYITILDWTSYIVELAWTSFVTALTWDAFVSELDWSGFVSNLDWNGYVGDMEWGDYIGSLDWSRFVPRLAAAAIAGNASGTNYWRGGLTWVGEEGPELVNMPRGARIHSNEESMAMAGGVSVTVNVASVSSDIDIHALAAKVGQEIRRNMRP